MVNGIQPGAFLIVNEGPLVRLRTKGEIEKRVEGRWAYTGIVYELMEKCPAPDGPVVMLRPRQELRPAPWTGFDCEAQCPRPCRMNEYAGAGEYRLVIRTEDEKHCFRGPVFRLPAAPAGRF